MKKVLALTCLLIQITSYSQQLKSTGFKNEWHLASTTGFENGDMTIFFINTNVTKYTALKIDSNSNVKESVPLSKSFVLEGYTHSRFTLIDNKKGYAIVPSKGGNYFLFTDENLVQTEISITDPKLKNGEVLNVRQAPNGNPQWLVGNVLKNQLPELYLVEYDKAQNKITSSKYTGGTFPQGEYNGKFLCKDGNFEKVYFINWTSKSKSFTISRIKLEENSMIISEGTEISLSEDQSIDNVELVEEFGSFKSNVVATLTLTEKGIISDILIVTDQEEEYQINKLALSKIIDTKILKNMTFGVYNTSFGSYIFSKVLPLYSNGISFKAFLSSSVEDLVEGDGWQIVKKKEGSFLDYYNGPENFDHTQIYSLPIFMNSFDPKSLNNPNDVRVELGALNFDQDKIRTFVCLKNEKYIPEFGVIDFVATPLSE